MKKQRIGYCDYVYHKSGFICNDIIIGGERGAMSKKCDKHTPPENLIRRERERKRKAEIDRIIPKGVYTIGDLRRCQTPEKFAKMVNQITSGLYGLTWNRSKGKKK